MCNHRLWDRHRRYLTPDRDAYRFRPSRSRRYNHLRHPYKLYRPRGLDVYRCPLRYKCQPCTRFRHRYKAYRPPRRSPGRYLPHHSYPGRCSHRRFDPRMPHRPLDSDGCSHRTHHRHRPYNHSRHRCTRYRKICHSVGRCRRRHKCPHRYSRRRSGHHRPYPLSNPGMYTRPRSRCCPYNRLHHRSQCCRRILRSRE